MKYSKWLLYSPWVLGNEFSSNCNSKPTNVPSSPLSLWTVFSFPPVALSLFSPFHCFIVFVVFHCFLFFFFVVVVFSFCFPYVYWASLSTIHFFASFRAPDYSVTFFLVLTYSYFFLSMLFSMENLHEQRIEKA